MTTGSALAALEETKGKGEKPPNQDTPDIPDSFSEIVQTLGETLIGIWKSFLEHTPYLLAGIMVLVVTWFIASLFAKLGHRLFRSREIRKSLEELIIRLITIGIWMCGLLLAAMFWFPGLTPAKAMGGLGIASIAVGFAFRDIFENFFAGILLLWRFPFESGDFIECEGILGRVESVNVRMTLIRLTTGELVVVPNSTLFKNPVNILTNQPSRRVTLTIGVAYGENVSDAVDVIEKAVKGCSSVESSKPIEIFPNSFGSSSIDIEVTWWTGNQPENIRRSRGEVVTAVKKALDDAGIEIPFPYRTLTFKEPLITREEETQEKDAPENP